MRTTTTTTVAAIVVALATPALAADLGAKDIAGAIDTYRANEIRFTRDYAGKSIEFTWTFSRAKAKLFGSGYRVTIGTGGLTGNVDCSVTEQKLLDQIVEWNKGQKVRVRGVVEDVTMGDLQLKECTIEAVR